MKQEDKELLLKDLCSRLPYRVVVELDEKFGFNKGTHTLVKELLDSYCVEGIKPYLRPMTSMTEEERIESLEFTWIDDYGRLASYDKNIPKYIDWLNKKMFDYRGLIPMNLALEAPEGMYKIE